MGYGWIFRPNPCFSILPLCPSSEEKTRNPFLQVKLKSFKVTWNAIGK
jgi:hypothetical protein